VRPVAAFLLEQNLSASAIADALVTMFQAASAFGPAGAGKDYSVMETGSGSAVVISWQGIAHAPQTFGDPTLKENIWQFALQAYVKDTGSNVNPRTLTLADIVISTIQNDDTLLGTVDQVIGLTGSRAPGEAYSVGGNTWLESRFELIAREFVE
jgi:hypothetical protein